MDIRATLGQLVDHYRDQHGVMADVVHLEQEDWKRSYLAIRRDMAKTVVQIAGLVNPIQTLGLAPSLSDRFRSAFSTMRHHIAMHQADWPVVAIDPRNARYQQSLTRLQQARRDFFSVADEVLQTLQARR